jgi:hypothetical protein
MTETARWLLNQSRNEIYTRVLVLTANVMKAGFIIKLICSVGVAYTWARMLIYLV